MGFPEELRVQVLEQYSLSSLPVQHDLESMASKIY
jgi:hypothetical protein